MASESGGAIVWNELSAALRDFRKNAGMSLRAVEAATGWGRGSLSQIENSLARPTRRQVEWYDEEFDADGLCVALFGEARGAHGPSAHRDSQGGHVEGDAVTVLDVSPAMGEIVEPDSTVAVRITLGNTGGVAWQGRSLRRVGLRNARGLIASPAGIVVPACEPGGVAVVRFAIRMPEVVASFVACFEIVDEQQRTCYDGSALLWLRLTAHPQR